MATISGLTAIKALFTKMQNNGLARFAYTQTAYDNGEYDGNDSYSFDKDMNVPTKAGTDTNDTVLSKGFRSQESSIARNFVNHFFGRTSFNLNKSVDNTISMQEWLAAYFATSGVLYDEYAAYATGDVCFTLVEWSSGKTTARWWERTGTATETVTGVSPEDDGQTEWTRVYFDGDLGWQLITEGTDLDTLLTYDKYAAVTDDIGNACTNLPSSIQGSVGAFFLRVDVDRGSNISVQSVYQISSGLSWHRALKTDGTLIKDWVGGEEDAIIYVTEWPESDIKSNKFYFNTNAGEMRFSADGTVDGWWEVEITKNLGATAFTFVVYSQGRFEKWCNNTSGEDYTHVAVLGGPYSVDTLATITGTKSVRGFKSATIQNVNLVGCEEVSNIKISNTVDGACLSSCDLVTGCELEAVSDYAATDCKRVSRSEAFSKTAGFYGCYAGFEANDVNLCADTGDGGFNLATMLEAPVISSSAGQTFKNSTTITVTNQGTAPTDAILKYTTDGTAITESATTYESPFTLTETALIKAAACKTVGDTDSDDSVFVIGSTAELQVTRQVELLAPTITSSEGEEFESTTTVTITSNGEPPDEAVIRYTTDGSDVTLTSDEYTGAFEISATTTIKAALTYKTQIGTQAEVVLTNGAAIITITSASTFTETAYEDVTWSSAPKIKSPATSWQTMAKGTAYDSSLNSDTGLYELKIDLTGITNFFYFETTGSAHRVLKYKGTGNYSVSGKFPKNISNFGFCNFFYNDSSLTSFTATLPAETLYPYCYYQMFRGTGITSAPTLPSTEMAAYCYYGMFELCNSLTEPPSLPAETLASNCYARMFANTSFSTPPVLPATKMEDSCYYQMFYFASITSAPELPATELAENCYYNMFDDCTKMVTPPSELPATTLLDECYKAMFSWCTSLSSAPKLPAKTLAASCYYQMFRACTSLTESPELPAETLAENCYYGMFNSCIGLKTAPELPATTLAEGCYSHMFYGCTGLKTAPELPATELATNCYNSMFYQCSSLTSSPELPATTLAEGCYSSMFNMFGVTSSLTTAPASINAEEMPKDCCDAMFYNCTSLTTVPTMSATTFGEKCCRQMFWNCTNITSAPAIHAETLAAYCCAYMFSSCTSLKFSETQTTECANAYRIPTEGTGTGTSDWNNDMFSSTSGTYTDDPAINTTYYTNATIVS